METLSAMQGNPLIYKAMFIELHTISVGSNGEAMAVCEPWLHYKGVTLFPNRISKQAKKQQYFKSVN